MDARLLGGERTVVALQGPVQPDATHTDPKALTHSQDHPHRVVVPVSNLCGQYI
ncbi:hypothetical protein [Nonomuraea sp. NPDC001831]|uniref:hypothetical protein n=1 Tax=Nonomuraea sp. NPDC001831 TaxID=3364340 RepID=UPI003686C0FA